jgi:tetratricopeptide (TPR) repeat protein
MTIVRRDIAARCYHRFEGRPPLEQQEHPALPGIERLEAIGITRHREQPEHLGIKRHGPREIIDVKDGFDHAMDTGSRCVGHEFIMRSPFQNAIHATNAMPRPYQHYMKLLLFSLCLGMGVNFAHADEADDLIKSALIAEAAFDSQKALKLFQAADAARPNDPFILQKISKQYSDSTIEAAAPEKKKRQMELALEYAQRSHELEPNNAVHTLSIAICYGKLGLYSDVRTKIKYVRLTKEFADQAVQLDPDYDWAYHVLGRWQCEVAQLGGTKRFMIGLLFGGLPEASTEEGIRLLQRSVDLAPNNPSHHIELGFAYLADQQPAAARKAFAAGLALPNSEKYDEVAKQRAREALKTLG